MLEDSLVLDGIMLNKDITHSKMHRRIVKPRIVLLDSNLEYKKGESQTNIEISREEDFSAILKLEEDYIQNVCNAILSVKPDLVITEYVIISEDIDSKSESFHQEGHFRSRPALLC
jgi:T-complex protein 1 subunit gamma